MNSPTLTSPPWTLQGYGYVALYRLPAEFCRQYVTSGQFQGGLSALIIANYQSSDVGPYQEIIFLPGVVQYPQTKGYSITQIYVSTMISVINGIENWALPKQLADFHFEQTDKHTEQIRVSREHQKPFADMTFTSGGLKFPVTGFILPKLHQVRNETAFITRFKASGWGQLARMTKAEFNHEDFPDLAPFRSFITMKISSFKINFLSPQKHP